LVWLLRLHIPTTRLATNLITGSWGPLESQNVLIQ
jgi:hypothetical protein